MQIYELLYHLKQCPEDFLKKWESGVNEKSFTEVLVKDAYRRIMGKFDVADYALPAAGNYLALTENHQLSIQIACWFFSYGEFMNKAHLPPRIHLFLMEDLLEVCELIKYREWVEDDDRAEEFIRLALRRCEIIPEGETNEEAADKLDALDSIKRQSVLKESNEAMERIREIRRKMAEQKAREAANAYSRE